jgi:hypothetical protein
MLNWLIRNLGRVCCIVGLLSEPPITLISLILEMLWGELACCAMIFRIRLTKMVALFCQYDFFL